MSVPLDNLYNWIKNLLPVPAVVYVFQPHGSKKISDLTWFENYNQDTAWQLPEVFAHDQEILDWEFYNQPAHYLDRPDPEDLSLWRQLRNKFSVNFNLKSIALLDFAGIYDQTVLIHSEKNSKDLIKYQQNGFVCVHYWAHAVIAQDWYRFAEHDTRLDKTIPTQKKFLIYCRDWSHRREYRLKFLELLVKNNLNCVSQTSVMHVNSENVHISQHQFANPAFELTDPDLINCIPSNTFSSAASADYEYFDFINAEISVVLETIFDDSRIHLTEKTLRPIACGHPFILAAGPGALEYIQSYGFKTFAPWIDESYDLESNSLRRLEKIIQAMKQIQNLQGQELVDFQMGIKQIAEFNKKHFFSKEFLNQVETELKDNLHTAFDAVKQTRGKNYLDFIKLSKKHQAQSPSGKRVDRTRFLRQLRRSCRVDRSNPPGDQTV